MASIRKEFTVAADASKVWDAVRDFGAVHTRLAPGFVTACRVEGGARHLMFANGLQATELLLGVDDDNRRLAYAIAEGRTTHYQGTVQLDARESGSTRVVWIVDVLPDAFGPAISEMMEHGVAAMQHALASH